MSNELNSTFKDINKSHPNTISKSTQIKVPYRIPTGIFTLDYSLCGGIPRNRVTHLVGAKHAGKSTLSYRIIANTQRLYPDQEVTLIDAEGTFDPVWATIHGVDLEALNVAICETGELAADIASAVVQSQETSLIVLDSLAFCAPNKELESSVADANVANQARLLNKLVRKLNSDIIHERKRGHYPTVLLLNQFRINVGIMFGDNRTVPGGKAVEHVASVDIEIKNKEKKYSKGAEKDRVEFNEHAFTIRKNKCNSGVRAGDFNMIRYETNMFDLPVGAIDEAKALLNYAKRDGILTGAGKGQKLEIEGARDDYANQEDMMRHLYEDPELHIRLRNELIALEAIRSKMPEDYIAHIYDHDYFI